MADGEVQPGDGEGDEGGRGVDEAEGGGGKSLGEDEEGGCVVWGLVLDCALGESNRGGEGPRRERLREGRRKVGCGGLDGHVLGLGDREQRDSNTATSKEESWSEYKEIGWTRWTVARLLTFFVVAGHGVSENGR